MSDRKKIAFRVGGREVRRALEQCVAENFGVKALEFLKDKKILVSVAERREVFLANNEQFEIYNELVEHGRYPYFIGLFAGILLGRGTVKIRPSLDLFEKLFKIASSNAIVITDKAVENILYGKDLLVEGVERILEPIGPYPLLVNRSYEVVGLGELILPPLMWGEAKPNDVVARNIMDKGWYLRRGG